MAEDTGLTNFFEKYLEKDPLFKDKQVLQVKYIPETILHRTEQMNQLASILAPALRTERPSNVFLYGKSGTGKTLVTLFTLKKLNETAKSKDIPIRTLYLNCKLKRVADTEYRLIAQLARDVGVEVPVTGLPTDEVYNLFIREIDSKKQILIIALDEIDRIVLRAGDEILYNLTRLNSELKNAQIAIVGITNDVRFIENIDARVRSSLSEEEMVFAPYNAVEIKEILADRAKTAFKEGTIEEGVLAKCAAYAAREHGDARRALDLLRVAGELAEREGVKKIEEKHIDEAEEKIEKSRVVEILEKQPKQSQAVMLAILNMPRKKIETGEVFEKYVSICEKGGLHPLTQRRLSDLLSELDMLGLINAKVISKGRYGRTREIYVGIPSSLIEKVREQLEKALF